MVLEFLNRYAQAISLDDVRFRPFFSVDQKRADFLLFEESTVCEFKELKAFDVPARIERLAINKNGNNGNFKRDFYNTANKALSAANDQIEQTKYRLAIPDSLGLIIFENLIASDVSVLTLVDSANRKMLSGLKSVDAVLCLDFVNSFVDKNGRQVRICQVVTRDTERSRRLEHLVAGLMRDFTAGVDVLLLSGFNISAADQRWIVDADKKFKNLTSTLEINGEGLGSSAVS